ncbi:MAG TPA: LysR substrate-binding domain-containing protein [Bryobacteraceae bacterium]|jgi:DNA-binding transcriptional LysR family regulator
MELRHLRYFCAVAERQSFTQAARHLHVSQSGLSGQVRDLEKEIGVTLLQRNQRQVSLTPEGAVFLREAREILAHSERAVEMAVRASQGQYGKLSVGLCGPATSPFLPGLIRGFRKLQPGVTVALKDMDPARQPAALAEGIIDVGFTRSVPAEFRKILSSEIFFREPLIAALPKGHPLANEPAIRLAQLATEPFVLNAREGAPELFDAIIGFCKKAKFSPRVVDSPSLWQTVLTLVEAGEGVSLIPACVKQLRSNGVVFQMFSDRCRLLDVVLAWRQEEPSAIRDGFLRLLRKNLPEIERRMQQMCV